MFAYHHAGGLLDTDAGATVQAVHALPVVSCCVSGDQVIQAEALGNIFHFVLTIGLATVTLPQRPVIAVFMS